MTFPLPEIRLNGVAEDLFSVLRNRLNVIAEDLLLCVRSGQLRTSLGVRFCQNKMAEDLPSILKCRLNGVAEDPSSV